eukprot:271503_1
MAECNTVNLFKRHDGHLQGKIITKRKMTIFEAQQYALNNLSNCIGFTFKGKINDKQRFIQFKEAGNNQIIDTFGAHSYLLSTVDISDIIAPKNKKHSKKNMIIITKKKKKKKTKKSKEQKKQSKNTEPDEKSHTDIVHSELYTEIAKASPNHQKLMKIDVKTNRIYFKGSLLAFSFKLNAVYIAEEKLKNIFDAVIKAMKSNHYPVIEVIAIDDYPGHSISRIEDNAITEYCSKEDILKKGVLLTLKQEIRTKITNTPPNKNDRIRFEVHVNRPRYTARGSDQRFEENVVINARYHKDEKINNIFQIITKYLNKKHDPTKVRIEYISELSFVGEAYTDERQREEPLITMSGDRDEWSMHYEWSFNTISSVSDKSITEYERDDIYMIDVAVMEDIELFTELAKLPGNKDDLIRFPGDTFGRFRTGFIVYAVYKEEELINNIYKAIFECIETRHYPKRIKIAEINDASFTGQQLFYQPAQIGDCPITQWEKKDIIQKGLSLQIETHFTHQIVSESVTCEFLKKSNDDNPLLCPIYHAMKQKYQFNQQNLEHLQNYTHFKDQCVQQKPPCEFESDCKAYTRCENGENRLDDLCHLQIYRHPPRTRQIKLSQNIHHLVINETERDNHWVYFETDEDKIKYKYNETDGFLNALVEEVVNNGFRYDLCLRCGKYDDCKHDDYSLLTIVDDKIQCDRHKSMDCPLNRGEMLSFILYTGCDCNYDLCGSQRKGDYEKWTWFDHCLYNGITKLSAKESGSFDVYTGLHGVKLNRKSVDKAWFITYVSTSWRKDVALSFMASEGMIIKIDKDYKNDELHYHRTSGINCCDVSWISKFMDECEILFARSIDESDVFGLNVKDESSGIQFVTLDSTTLFHGWTMDGATYM